MVLQLAEIGGSEAIARLLYVADEFDSIDDYIYDFKERNSLVDYDDQSMVDYETVSTKTGRDLSISKVIPEYQNYLTFNPVLPRKISPFDRLAEKAKAEKSAEFIRGKLLAKFLSNGTSKN